MTSSSSSSILLLLMLAFVALLSTTTAAEPTTTAAETTTKENETPDLLRRKLHDDNVEVNLIPSFSADTTVDVLHRGPMAMKDLQVGDWIRTASDRTSIYEPVYAFGHYLPNRKAEFLAIETHDGSTTLEVTREHLIFKTGTSFPVRAGTIRVGDRLQPQDATVTRIDTIHKTGLYAPLVPSGSFLVTNHNDNNATTTLHSSLLLVSSYARLVQDSDHAHFQNGRPFFSQHDGIHLVLTPYRAFCTAFLGNAYCHPSHYTEEGYPTYVATGMDFLAWADNLPLVAQVVLFVVALLAFGAMRMMELYDGVAMWMVLVVGILLWRRLRLRRVSVHGTAKVESA